MTINIYGKDYTYSGSDTWIVQVGKGKGSYQDRYSLKTPYEAMYYYNAINIGRGYKKRLILCQASNKIKIARSFS